MKIERVELEGPVGSLILTRSQVAKLAHALDKAPKRAGKGQRLQLVADPKAGELHVLVAAPEIKKSEPPESRGMKKIAKTQSQCVQCGLTRREKVPDPCLGMLPGVTSACCGHGEREGAYILFTTGVAICGFEVGKFVSEADKVMTDEFSNGEVRFEKVKAVVQKPRSREP